MITKPKPNILFDGMIGISFPTRVFQRVTREEANARAQAIGYRVNWDSARMIGNCTAEVSIVRAFNRSI